MVNTTQNEFPKDEQPKPGDVNKKAIVGLYQEGKNLYFIAGEVFGFTSDEAVEKVRQTLSDAGYLDKTHKAPETRIED